MYVKYVYATREDCDYKGIHRSWIEECEACNYVFRVLGEREGKWAIKTSSGTSYILKERCVEYVPIEEITLPKELFEI